MEMFYTNRGRTIRYGDRKLLSPEYFKVTALYSEATPLSESVGLTNYSPQSSHILKR